MEKHNEETKPALIWDAETGELRALRTIQAGEAFVVLPSDKEFLYTRITKEKSDD